jgi:dsRNA-specific ribonuclease
MFILQLIANIKYMNIDFEAVKKQIRIDEFKRLYLLEIALTHPSYLNEVNPLCQEQRNLKEREYRRLATLGDAIFNAIVVDYLYHQLPDADRGELSKLKNSIITREQAGEFASELNLKQLCLLGRGERQKDEVEQTEMFGEMFEALLCAIYLEFERDFNKTKSWLINRFLQKKIANVIEKLYNIGD